VLSLAVDQPATGSILKSEGNKLWYFIFFQKGGGFKTALMSACASSIDALGGHKAATYYVSTTGK